MSVFFFQENVSVLDLDEEKIGKWLSDVVVAENRTMGVVNVVFCNDEYLLELNIKHLNHDYYTDILTFDYCEDRVVSGDLFISWERIKDNATQVGTQLIDELHRVCVHGVLHLCGYKDKSPEDKKLMTSKEDFYLNTL